MLAMVANDQAEEYRTMDTFCDAGDYRLLARISFYFATIGFWPGLDFAVCSFSTRVATHSLWLGFEIAVWPGLDFVVGSFSKRVATYSLWPGFDFAVCTFPYRMARVMECFAKIGCPILKFHVIIDFVILNRRASIGFNF